MLSMSNPLLQTLASMGGTSVSGTPTSASLAGGPMGAVDASSMSKMQQDYQQQLSN
jgi:hypothetical protein